MARPVSRILAFAPIVQAASVTKLKLAQDIDYPPYAYKDEKTGALAGLGHDVALGTAAVCADVEIEVVQAKWSDCWTPEGLGVLLENGTFDACLTYTHTRGMRHQLAEFSYGILGVDKPAGLLTRLDEGGIPIVNGYNDLSGKTVVDVGGWAPTKDGLAFVKNQCTGNNYASDIKVLLADGSDNNNDLALAMLLDGSADAMFVYADQAFVYIEACAKGTQTLIDCSMWAGFGSKFAYVQTGQFAYAVNGTTLAMAKKGSGVAAKLNPCLQKFMESKDYFEICSKHGLLKACIPNKFFPNNTEAIPSYQKATSDLRGDCSDGYCPCVLNTARKKRAIGVVAFGIALLSI